MFHTVEHKRASTVLKDGTTYHDSEVHVEDMSLPPSTNPIDEKATVSGNENTSQGVTEFSGRSSNLNKLHKPKLPPIQDTINITSRAQSRGQKLSDAMAV